MARRPEFRIPETIRVVRQGAEGPYVEIDGKMLPFYVEDVATHVTRSPGIEVTVTFRAQRVLTVNDWLSQRDRDRIDRERMVKDAERGEGGG